MLRDSRVDPLSTYDRELPKFISDSRIAEIPKHLRREAFERYCAENQMQAIERKEELKLKYQQNFIDWVLSILQKR